MRFVPPMPRSHYYHEEVTSYHIVQTDYAHSSNPDEPHRSCRKILYSSTSARMTWLMLRAMIKYQRPHAFMEVQMVYEGKLYGMLTFQFMNMIHGNYCYRDAGQDSPYIEWIEVHEPQQHTTETVYCGTWYEVYLEVARWSPERRKQVHVAVMRQQRPTADYNPPYVEYAYQDADEFWAVYDNWCALMSYDKSKDYYPIFDEIDEAEAV